MICLLCHYWMKSQATAVISAGLQTYRLEAKWKMDQLMEKLPHSVDSRHLRHFYHVDMAWTHFLHYCICVGYTHITVNSSQKGLLMQIISCFFRLNSLFNKRWVYSELRNLYIHVMWLQDILLFKSRKKCTMDDNTGCILWVQSQPKFFFDIVKLSHINIILYWIACNESYYSHIIAYCIAIANNETHGLGSI